MRSFLAETYHLIPEMANAFVSNLDERKHEPWSIVSLLRMTDAREPTSLRLLRPGIAWTIRCFVRRSYMPADVIA